MARRHRRNVSPIPNSPVPRAPILQHPRRAASPARRAHPLLPQSARTAPGRLRRRRRGETVVLLREYVRAGGAGGGCEDAEGADDQYGEAAAECYWWVCWWLWTAEPLGSYLCDGFGPGDGGG